MGINPVALYLDLLEDLSEYLDTAQLFELQTSGSTSAYPDSTVKQVAAVALANSFLKKFKDKTSESADAKCLEEFQSVNSRCGSWELKLDSSSDELLFGELKLAIYNFLNPKGMPLISTFSEILDQGDVGPGASCLANGDDFYTKLFSGKISSTSESLYDVYVNYFDPNQSWHDANCFREAMHGEVEVIRGNRMSYVPKNADTSRLICTEPSLNMFFQLGIGRILHKRLRQSFKIDFATQQEINRELAREGSRGLKGDGLVTIDLSSASDSLSLKMLEKVLPSDFLAWLLLTRSPETEMPNGASMQLNMVSTMGNGFTFPLQTMLFACVVRAAYRVHYTDLTYSGIGKLGNFGVFGDDIICEQKVSRSVIRLLTLLGFRVNDSKSFLEGPFRESCGGDFHKGHNVRGVYCKTLRTTESRYAVINQLNLWSARQGIPLVHSVGRLHDSVRKYYVPVWENEDAGIRVTSRNLTSLTWSKRYHSLIYKKWVAKPRRITIGEGLVHVPKGLKPRDYNPEGLLLAFLRGNIERGYITVRQRTALYSTRTGVAPNWDTTPTGSALPADISLPDLGWAVAANCSAPR